MTTCGTCVSWGPLRPGARRGDCTLRGIVRNSRTRACPARRRGEQREDAEGYGEHKERGK